MQRFPVGPQRSTQFSNVPTKELAIERGVPRRVEGLGRHHRILRRIGSGMPSSGPDRKARRNSYEPRDTKGPGLRFDARGRLHPWRRHGSIRNPHHRDEQQLRPGTRRVPQGSPIGIHGARKLQSTGAHKSPKLWHCEPTWGRDNGSNNDQPRGQCDDICSAWCPSGRIERTHPPRHHVLQLQHDGALLD